MSDKKSNNILKIVIGILILLLLGAIIFGVSSSNELKAAKSDFEVQKSIKVEELKSLQAQYDTLIDEDAANKEEIIAANERITRLIDSVSNLEASVAVVGKLRNSQAYFKKQLEKLKVENEALKQENALLYVQKDSLSTELQTAGVLNDSITVSNTKLQEVVTKAQELQITNITQNSVRIKDSNKVIETSKAKRVTGFEVCYNVAPNAVAEQGDRQLYIQVMDPTKNIIGGQYFFTEGDKKIAFSKLSKFRYTNKAMKICDFVEPLENETFTAGTYTINVFNGVTLISTNTITLK